MLESTPEYLRLKFREESVSNVIYEEAADFGSSVSNKAYYRAYQITKVIIKINQQFRERGKKNGTALRNSGQFFNIIAFTGERGTGKTSAMLSYMEFLKDYNRNLHLNKGENLGRLRFKDGDNDLELMFTGLEYIDASLLGSKNDDILRNVLPKMLQKWKDEEKRSYRDSGIVKDEDYSYKKRQIQMLFNRVYQSLRDLNSKQDILESDNDTFMETLKNLSLTWNLRQSFQELVEAYLNIMEYPGSEKRIGLDNHFLLITIDDLDMNIEHGFNLLEEIRKYLMVPNVIVLLSASYEQLEKLCMEHYAKTFKETKAEEGSREYIARLSREYLEKILPAHCQVLLEPVHRWKAYDHEELRVEYTNVDEEVHTVGEGTLQSIVRDVYKNYFEMKFSVKGRCLFYLMPSTTRELAFWVRQIYSMDISRFHLDNIRNKMKNDIQTEDYMNFQNNLRWFRRERLPRMYEKYLHPTDSMILDELERLEPQGQIRTIKKAVGGDGKTEKSLLELLGNSITMGTKEKQALSALSIIYFTAKLTKLFAQWHQNDNEELKERALRDIRQYFSDGIWEKWEERLMCEIVTQSGTYHIARIEFKVMNHCMDQVLQGQFKNNYDSKLNFIKNNSQTLINYQCLLQFFEFSSDFNFSEAKLSETDEKNYQLELGKDEYGGKFALSNIMRPWEDKEGVLNDFQNNLLRILGASKEDRLGMAVLNEINIHRQDYYDISLPFENIEFLIHMGQRLQEQLGDHVINNKSAELIRPEIKKYFMLIRNCLGQYDAENKTSYKDNFDKTLIGTELNRKEPESVQNAKTSGKDPKPVLNPKTDLFGMLSECIIRAAVPKQLRMTD